MPVRRGTPTAQSRDDNQIAVVRTQWLNVKLKTNYACPSYRGTCAKVT
jgi:hypothetical protein